MSTEDRNKYNETWWEGSKYLTDNNQNDTDKLLDNKNEPNHSTKLDKEHVVNPNTEFASDNGAYEDDAFYSEGVDEDRFDFPKARSYQDNLRNRIRNLK